MRVMKFGGTSVGSAVQIRKVAGLIGNKSPKIVVLSAMSGTTNTLVEIAGTLKDGDRFRFGELVGQLEFKYVETVNDLFGTESCRRLAVDGMTDCFRTLWKMPQAGYTPENEKVILAQGELLSTLLMHLCLKEMNIESVVLPATANPMGGSSAAICANICDSTASAPCSSRKAIFAAMRPERSITCNAGAAIIRHR